jgi:glutamate---cysteine ligase / carboxylate-amine ligase
MTVRRVGVEEEFLLVEAETGRPRAVAGTVLATARSAVADLGDDHGRGVAGDAAARALGFELQLQQVEANTQPCRGLGDLGREVRRCRSWAAGAAGKAGAQIAALGTSPVPVAPELADHSRYQKMARAFGLTAYEQLTCGCHVHVEVSSAEEGVAVLDRIGPWLAILLALSANSPFWQGRDSAYASFRYQVWGRWPTSGPAEVFGSAGVYRQTVEQMLRTRTLLDTGMVYFDARLSERYPTVEVRIADVCLLAQDTVLIAALARALVETEASRWREGQPTGRGRTELLRLSAWRASRSGLDDVLISPVTGLPEQAAAVANLLLDHVRDALDEAGDTGTVHELLAAVLARGNGATFQRNAHRGTGSLAQVVISAAEATAR